MIDFVQETYNTLLGREGDDFSVVWWADKIESGALRKEELVQELGRAIESHGYIFNPRTQQYQAMKIQNTVYRRNAINAIKENKGYSEDQALLLTEDFYRATKDWSPIISDEEWEDMEFKPVGAYRYVDGNDQIWNGTKWQTMHGYRHPKTNRVMRGPREV